MLSVDSLFAVLFNLCIVYGALVHYKQWRRDNSAAPPNLRWRKIVATVILAASVLTWFTWFDIYIYYGRTRSNVANTSSGRLYSLANHGQVFYVTLKERNWLFLLTAVAFVLFFSGYMLDRSVSSFRAQTEERAGTRE